MARKSNNRLKAALKAKKKRERARKGGFMKKVKPGGRLKRRGLR